MRSHPRIVILADFPARKVDPTIPEGRGWKYAVWLVSLYETLKTQTLYDIHWVSFCREISRYRCIEAGGQTFHFFPCGSLTLARVQHFAWDRWRVDRLLTHLQPDLIHAWGTESRYGLCGLASSSPKILSMQGVLTAIHQRCPFGGFYWRLPVRSEKRLMETYDLVTCESLWGCERCLETAPAAHVVRWEYAPNPDFFRILRDPAPKPYILMAGSDTALKNVEMAIDVFRDPALSGVELWGAGMQAHLHANLPPNVRPLGGVSHKRIAELLSRAWGLIHPSLADTSPNIVKEARVMGLPVVVSSECGGAQYVEQGKSGFVVSPYDREGMVRAVAAITANRETSLAMGKHAWEECRRQLSIATMAARLEQIYAHVLHGEALDPY